MKLLDALVEQRIAAAAARGEFDNLPGAGAPLDLDEEPLVPEEVRVANRILKNAGFVPPAVEQLRALRDLQADLEAVTDPAVRGRLQARMLALEMAVESLRGSPFVPPREYCRRIVERLCERTSSDVGSMPADAGNSHAHVDHGASTSPSEPTIDAAIDAAIDATTNASIQAAPRRDRSAAGAK